MKAICLYLQIHQPLRLKRYRFFDIGNDHYYYDDFANDEIFERVAMQSYIPTCDTILGMIEQYGKKFKCAISISGIALEQAEQFAPELIDRLKRMADTGCVEFLAETYAHSLASLVDPEEFAEQLKVHDEKLNALFGVKPKVLRNAELIFCDEIAHQILAMGYKGVITEGAKHILGWKSPNYLYASAAAPKLKMLLKNDRFSDDITFRFSDTNWSEFPLTADKYISWIADTPPEEQIVNLFMNMETFGGFQNKDTGIFQFLQALPRFAAERGVEFITPTEAVTKLKPVGELAVPFPISWADEARDTSAWLGNSMQREAYNKLYSVSERVRLCDDRRLKQDWWYLQASDHFFYMSTKHQADGVMHSAFSPYDSPYQAFTNYMNVLSDFIVRVEEQYPLSIENEELNALLTTIRNQAREIETLNKEVASMRNNIEHYNEERRLRQDMKQDSENTPAKPQKVESKATKAEPKTAKVAKPDKAPAKKSAKK